MAIPVLLGYGSCAENLLFRVFLRRVVVGKELVGVWVLVSTSGVMVIQQ